jgi:hypothetical protein
MTKFKSYRKKFKDIHIAKLLDNIRIAIKLYAACFVIRMYITSAFKSLFDISMFESHLIHEHRVLLYKTIIDVYNKYQIKPKSVHKIIKKYELQGGYQLMYHYCRPTTMVALKELRTLGYYGEFKPLPSNVINDKMDHIISISNSLDLSMNYIKSNFNSTDYKVSQFKELIEYYKHTGNDLLKYYGHCYVINIYNPNTFELLPDINTVVYAISEKELESLTALILATFISYRVNFRKCINITYNVSRYFGHFKPTKSARDVMPIELHDVSSILGKFEKILSPIIFNEYEYKLYNSTDYNEGVSWY